MKQLTLFETNSYTEEEIKAILLENEVPEEEITDSMIYDEMELQERIDFEDFESLCRHLDKYCNGLVVIADIGLWNGRRSGYKELDYYEDIPYVFNGDCDYVKFELDRYNLIATEAHHDGTHYLTIREWKSFLTDQQKENFLNKLYDGSYTSKDVTRHTTTLRNKFKKVLGFK